MTRRLPKPTDVVQVSSFSDGDPNHVPTHPGYQLSNPDTYMRKIATEWMKNHGGGVVPGEWRQFFVKLFTTLQILSFQYAFFFV